MLLPFKHREGTTEWLKPERIVHFLERTPPKFGHNTEKLTPERERQMVERVFAFYESEDFDRFERGYDSWSALYDKELHEAHERRWPETLEREAKSREKS